MEPIILPVTDVLDLHTFNPKEVPDLLEDYFDECIKKGINTVRIIHGKGTGILKRKTRSVLKQSAKVASFQDAPAEAGGWGATIVHLTQRTLVNGQ